ncbi:response regulator [Aliigemmobacter aestuarii]|uniref:Response regulator n=2 Tax=Aliigemmobacter aestuarii TaxID=1445661 RepID=A0A4S3MMM9_9RHOB|nr:response regulator [Gemmobacter aestuarii]
MPPVGSPRPPVAQYHAAARPGADFRSVFGKAVGGGGLLAGVTILLVEDSRAAADTMRLMCQRLGARLRRADSAEAARRHLALYRPDAVLVDLGLPDEPGEALIAEIAASTGRPAALIGISGLIEGRGAALAAGVDGFLEKPLPGALALARVVMPLAEAHHPGAALAMRNAASTALLLSGARPDPAALRDDLLLADRLLALPRLAQGTGYVLGFLRGLGRITGDAALARMAQRVAEGDAPLAALADLVRDRIAVQAPAVGPASGSQGAGAARQDR